MARKERMYEFDRYLAWSNESVYPFYIWHQVVIVLLGYIVLQWGQSIFAGYMLVAAVSFVVSLGLTLLVRPQHHPQNVWLETIEPFSSSPHRWNSAAPLKSLKVRNKE